VTTKVAVSTQVVPVFIVAVAVIVSGGPTPIEVKVKLNPSLLSLSGFGVTAARLLPEITILVTNPPVSDSTITGTFVVSPTPFKEMPFMLIEQLAGGVVGVAVDGGGVEVAVATLPGPQQDSV
jgi:hypothetical protein